MATMTARSSTNATGSIAFLAAAPVGEVDGDEAETGVEGLEEVLEP